MNACLTRLLMIVGLAGCVLCGVVQAEAVADLDIAKVIVADKSTKTRKAALPDAMLQVLVRLSGNNAVGTLAPVKEKLPQAADYVERYRYHPFINKRWQLSFKFNRSALEDLLTESNQAVWGNERPLLATWLVMQAEHAQPKLIVETDHKIVPAYKTESQRRGLLILFPMLDLQDLSQVTAADVSAGELEKISLASKRYASEGVVVGTITQADGMWHAAWQMQYQNEVFKWQFEAITLNELLTRGVDNIADALAGRLAVLKDKTQHQSVVLTIGNIHSVNDYAKMTEYLQQLTPVAHVQMIKVTPNSVQYFVKLQSDVSNLKHALSTNHEIQIVPGELAAEEHQLEYQLIS